MGSAIRSTVTLLSAALTACLLSGGCHQAAAGQVKATGVMSSGKSLPYVWRNVQMVAGGFVTGLVFNPAARDVLYARTDIGGAYRWDAATGHWIPLLDWLGPADWNLTGVESVGVDPSDANRIYLAVGTYTNDWASNGAILRSSDQGRTWQRTGLPFKNGGNMDGRSAGERLAVDPNAGHIIFYGSRDNGLWRSSDSGATWQPVDNFPIKGPTNGVGIVFILFQRSSGHAGGPTPVLYAGVSQSGSGLYRSTDGGNSWQVVLGQPAGLLPQHGVLARDGSLYLIYGNAPGPNGMSDGAVWKLDTKTSVWTDVTPLKPGNPAGFGYAGLAVDAQHPATVMVATMDRWNPGDTLFRSLDRGRTWTDLGPQAVRDPSLSPYLTWGGKTTRLGWWLGALAIDPFRSGHALYGTGATIWASADVTNADTGKPTHWAVGALGVEETAVNDLVSPPSGAHLISALGDIDGFRHDDLTVSPRDGMRTNPTLGSTSSLDFAQNDPRIVVRVGSGAHGKSGAYSRDGGTTWSPFPSEPPGSRGSGSIAISSDGSVIVWVPNGSPPCLTRDRGLTWLACTGLKMGMRIISDRVNAAQFYALDPAEGALDVSKDGASTFTRAAHYVTSGDGQIYAAPDRAGDLWIISGGMLSHSVDGGASWIKISTAQGLHALGFGKTAPGRSYPILYIIGSVGGVAGIFRSDDMAVSWLRINDSQHQYATADVITGDPRVYGRVYVGTNGRGILYGDPVQN